jgi:outer membrane biosynthesis protein TonB
MRPLARLGFAMVLAAAAALVSGCDTLENMGSLLDNKTKLPGERKPVFPEGVPGVTPGVPPEMVKGYREPVVETPPPPVLAEQTQAAEAKPKPKPKPHAIQTAAKPQPAPVAQAAAPAPASATAPWPNQPQQQPQQPQQQPQAAWPSAPASGTISR